MSAPPSTFSLALTVGALALLASACATPGPPPAAGTAAPASTPVPQPSAATAPPQWRPGSAWVYAWTSGAQSGVKTVEVLETREINNVAFYLVRVGEFQHFYTRDLQWAGSMRDEKIESRMTPPEPWFAWPLEPGRRWVHQGVYEDRTGRTQRNETFSVVATEVVDVPAGRFNTFKIVRETDSRDYDQYWYAPEVGFYAKWVGRRGDMQFEEQLREYRPAPRLTPGSPPPPSPSTTK